MFVLLHGLGAGRGEWKRFRSTLLARGYGSLALDARGHGGSGGPGYRTFRSSTAWIRIERDLDAAFDYLGRKNIADERIILIGASIGANLALRASVRRSSSPFVVLFSPGYDYRGVQLTSAVRTYERPIIAAASRPDAYSFKTVSWMAGESKNRDSRFPIAERGHGVGMFEGKGGGAFLAKIMNEIDRLLKTTTSSGGSLRSLASP